MSKKNISLRCHCTFCKLHSKCLERVHQTMRTQLGGKALEKESVAVGVTSDQFAILLEEVRQLQEGQEDTALKLEKGVSHDPYIFKHHGNEN